MSTMTRWVHGTAMLLLVILVIPRLATADDVIPRDPPLRWWKGNIHTHSFWSDGSDFPEMICEWYRTRNYNFLALSDHNVLSEGERWMPYSTIKQRAGSQALKSTSIVLDLIGSKPRGTRTQPATLSDLNR